MSSYIKFIYTRKDETIMKISEDFKNDSVIGRLESIEDMITYLVSLKEDTKTELEIKRRRGEI